MFGYLKLRAKELVEKKSTLGQFLWKFDVRCNTLVNFFSKP